MNLLSRLVLIAIVLTAVGCMSSPAQAQAGFPYIAGYGGEVLQYTLGRVPVPPYFSLHPPVYYSYPVPRPYGYSPFPYPGEMETPVYKGPAPVEIINPHVKPQAPGKKTSGRVAGQGRMILNPFVKRSSGEPASGLARIGKDDDAR